MARMTEAMPNPDFYVLGEIYGGNVQDLKYGQSSPRFSVFDVIVDGVYQPPGTTNRGDGTPCQCYTGALLTHSTRRTDLRFFHRRRR